MSPLENIHFELCIQSYNLALTAHTSIRSSCVYFDRCRSNQAFQWKFIALFTATHKISPPALPLVVCVFALPSHLKAAARETLCSQNTIASSAREREREYIKFIQRSQARDIANVDTQNSASDSKKKCRSLGWAMMRCAPPEPLSRTDIIIHIYTYYCVPEKINKRDWFCSLCVGQENYCMYTIRAYVYKKNIRVCVCKWRP
jgi:hypothetical protein